jgi:hypothetical protein
VARDEACLDQWQREEQRRRRSPLSLFSVTYGLETWLTKKVGTNWQASNGARFDLNTNGLRPATWTSGDAAGLPMLPALIRYDECERGVVEHALRIVVKHSRAEFIYPARHYASVPDTTDPKVRRWTTLAIEVELYHPDAGTNMKAVLNWAEKIQRPRG